jgi:hypothetical protein
MVKVPAPVVTPFDLAEIAATPGIRIGYTPFGEAPGVVKYYIGRSAPWKGFKKQAGESLDSYADRFKKTFASGKMPNVVEGLKKAIDISKRAAGTYGVAVVELAPGTDLARKVVLPLKVVKQMTETKDVKPIVRRAIAPGVSAKEVRKKYGVKGEYKSLVYVETGARATGVAPVPT